MVSSAFAIDASAGGPKGSVLKASMAAENAPAAAEPGAAVPAPTPVPVAKPVGGLSLGISAMWALVTNFFKKLFGGKPKA